MWKDPIVEDIKQRSQRYTKQFGYDIKAIAADIRKTAKQVSKPSRLRHPNERPREKQTV